jgi:NAD(P)-dependent dehydrogenase (short-subunit alcohol dehydrogenase family)
MKDFAGKVAVVTGAASGIGLALAHRFAAARMRVVLADIEPAPLADAARAVDAAGGETLAVRTDVAKAADVEALAARALDAFGAVHVLCNNAGVAVSGPAWLHTVSDWEWVLGVNLWGVIHGVRVFTPIMLAQDGEAHIVNTASMAGMVSAPGMSVYNVAKHGVVALSEALHHELAMLGSRVQVSVLCPGFVNTRILDSARNRPARLADTAPAMPASAEREHAVRQLLASGQPPAQVADCVFEAIRASRFYVFPNPDWKERIRARMEDILAERNPTPLSVQSLINPGLPE